MIDALLSRASARFIFVVGKGGVGKTTTAGAIALALADQSQATHLISTDPAHSLGDLFEQSLIPGQTTHSYCNMQLVLEEFAARKYADEFFRELRAPLIELIERGTYLDADDAAGFIDLSIPGIDEVMSALRLVELHESDVTRIVIDTAPTGHTIRLLDSPAVLESWVTAGRAMLEKADAVASALVGRALPLQAESLFAQWRAAVTHFNETILPNASAVVVTRRGRVVQPETERLLQALRVRGLRVAAMVSVAEAADGADFVIDELREPRGCNGLRAWKTHLHSVSAVTQSRAHWKADSRAQTHAHPDAADWIVRLSAKLLLVAGKGGVGKSTCAAAVASLQAEHRRVCLVSTDPAGSLSEVLGVDVGSKPVRVEANFYARQIDAITEFQRMREQYRSSVDEVFETLGLDQAARLDRRVVESLWNFAPPGIDEIISLVEIVEQIEDFDALIIDSAPTGHFLRLIEMPEIALDWVHALLRLLVKYGAVASLDALARDLLAFAKRLRQLKLNLSAPDTTAVFIVTLPEPMVRAETARLSSALQRAGVPVAAIILNKADDGERVAPGNRLWIRAPDLHEEAVGPAALRSFVQQWSLIGE